MSEAESHPVETTEADKVNSGAIGTVLAVGAAAVVAISFAIYALVRDEQSAFDEENGALANLHQVSELKRTQQEALNRPIGWSDANRSAVALPIGDAKQLFLKAVSENPFAASPGAPDTGAGGAGGAATGSAETLPTVPDAAAPAPEGAPTTAPTSAGTASAQTTPAPAPQAPQPTGSAAIKPSSVPSQVSTTPPPSQAPAPSAPPKPSEAPQVPSTPAPTAPQPSGKE